MKTKQLALILVLVGAIFLSFAFVGCTQRVQPTPPITSKIEQYSTLRQVPDLATTANESLSSAIERVEAGKVDRVFICRAPGVRTPIAMTPQILREVYTESVDYDLTPNRRLRLIAAFKNIAESQAQVDADMRLAVILIDTRNHWQYTLFSDGAGNLGYVGGRTAKMNGSLIQLSDAVMSGVQ